MSQFLVNNDAIQLCLEILAFLGENDVLLSKRLSWILRHGALKEGLPIRSDGYVNISDILNHNHFVNYTVEDVTRVVACNKKQRFSIRTENGSLQICANQGHSLTCVDSPNLSVVSSTEPIDVVHGTYYTNWNIIKTEGIKRMNRNHIHFSVGLPGVSKVTSGMRQNASANNVILSPGNAVGTIEPKYFLKVCDFKGNTLSSCVI